MTWVLTATAAWIVVALLVGVLLGRGIRLADRRDAHTADLEAANPNFVVDSGPLTVGPGVPPAGAATASSARPPAPRQAAEPRSNREHGLA